MHKKDIIHGVIVFGIVTVLLLAGYAVAQYANMLGAEKDTAPDMVACTMDAKECPDGSYVGRIGPDCEFAACPVTEEPTVSDDVIVCTEADKQNQICTKEYRPVCGLLQVQCITTPCDPVPQTFGNGCSACAQGNVISYTEGACEQN